MHFGEGFNGKTFFFLSLKYLVWTGIHFGILYGLLYADNERKFSETLLAVLMIPVGLVNVALLYTGIKTLKDFYWDKWLYGLVAAGNFILYVYVCLHMYNQAGAIIN